MPARAASYLDILLAEPRSGDDRCAKAANRLPVLAVAVVDDTAAGCCRSRRSPSPFTAAHGNFELDHDGILRRLSATKQSGDRSLTALSVEAASLVTGAPMPVGRSIAPAFRTRASAIPAISAADLLRDPAMAKRLRGKLVFIGPTALALGDRVLTPTTRRHQPDPGVTVHAAATESIIRGDVITELPPIAAGVVAAIGIARDSHRAPPPHRREHHRRRDHRRRHRAAREWNRPSRSSRSSRPPRSPSACYEMRIIVTALRSSEERYIDHRERDAESKRVSRTS